MRSRSSLKKQKPKSLSTLKKELDKVYSQYIRIREADHSGNVSCYTCGSVRHWKKMHCGHFVSRTYLATRWNENNTKVQCPGCNLFGGGKPLDFEENLKKELGDTVVEEMKHSRHQILKIDRKWYEEKIAFYENEVKKL